MKQGKTITILLTILACWSCSQKNKEIRRLTNENIQLMNHYIEALEKAETPEQMAVAIHDYAQKIREFAPKMRALKTRYPELQNTKEVPEGLEDITLRLEETTNHLVVASARTKKYEDNPAVKKAVEDLIQAWIDTK